MSGELQPKFFVRPMRTNGKRRAILWFVPCCPTGIAWITARAPGIVGTERGIAVSCAHLPGDKPEGFSEAERCARDLSSAGFRLVWDPCHLEEAMPTAHGFQYRHTGPGMGGQFHLAPQETRKRAPK